MKFYKHQRSRSFTDLDPRSLRFIVLMSSPKAFWRRQKYEPGGPRIKESAGLIETKLHICLNGVGESQFGHGIWVT